MTVTSSFPAITTKDKVASAHAFMKAGRLDEAEAVLADVLQERPSDAEALNALGGVALARKDPARASEILGAAATAFPDHADLVNNLGIAHQMAGRLDEAVICFERAVGLAPDADAPLHSLATARLMLNDPAGAREAALRLLARRPDAADAIGLVGVAALASGDTDEAEVFLRRALALDPGNAASLRSLSVCCHRGHRFAEALHLAERAVLAAPLDLDGLEHLARCQASLGLAAPAEANCRKVLAFAPNHLGMREILACVLIAAGQPDAGIAELTKLVKANPKSAEALVALAATLHFAGRLQQAKPFLAHALKLEPEHEGARLLDSRLALSLGSFPPRIETAGAEVPRIVVPPGMLAPEFILFSRFLTKLAEGGAAVELIAESRYEPIVAHLGVPITITPPGGAEPALPLPSLMRRFDLDAGSIGDAVPYLTARPDLSQRWLDALSEHPRPWIGVLWDIHPLGLTMTDLREALPEQGSAISLMTGEGRHALKAWPGAVDAGLHIDGLDQMIAAVAHLDIVVGPDVAALHLCGALGRPGVVATQAGFPWYWAARKGRALWYPTVEVLAQQRAGDWSGVVAALRAHLPQRLARPRQQTNARENDFT